MEHLDRAAVRRELDAWFTVHARPLPWREAGRSAWGIAVSEFMLQQTPVARVLPAWRAWMERWAGPADLAVATAADVIVAWDRLGYPRRALRLRDAAKAIVERHDGEVPDRIEQLRALPGVGEYTAAAIVAFAFGSPALVLDTNIRRVLARIELGQALPAPSLTQSERRTAAAWLPDEPTGPAEAPPRTPRGAPGALHLPPAARWSAAAMELGALVCTAATPRCDACPVRAHCRFLAAGRPRDPHAPRRRAQAWQGTDRQCRGRILAHLRESPAVTYSSLSEGEDVGQLERCLASLLADGLIERTGERICLPDR